MKKTTKIVKKDANASPLIVSVPKNPKYKLPKCEFGQDPKDAGSGKYDLNTKGYYMLKYLKARVNPEDIEKWKDVAFSCISDTDIFNDRKIRHEVGYFLWFIQGKTFNEIPDVFQHDMSKEGIKLALVNLINAYFDPFIFKTEWFHNIDDFMRVNSAFLALSSMAHNDPDELEREFRENFAA